MLSKILGKMSCSVGRCDWVYISEYDNDLGHAFGKYYKCSRCRSTKWVTYDGRVYFHNY